jgi:hypothetical protein
MVLSHQVDFLAEKPCLQTVIEAAGHKCYFLPKFHCKLNPIEMYWGWVKICEYLANSTLLESLISILGLHALTNGTFLTTKGLYLSSWTHVQQMSFRHSTEKCGITWMLTGIFLFYSISI